MRIEAVKGKTLIAILDPDAPVDRAVWRQITDRCRTGKVAHVHFVYPIARIDEVVDFFTEIATITGRPVQGFSHGDQNPKSKTRIDRTILDGRRGCA